MKHSKHFWRGAGGFAAACVIIFASFSVANAVGSDPIDYVNDDGTIDVNRMPPTMQLLDEKGDVAVS